MYHLPVLAALAVLATASLAAAGQAVQGEDNRTCLRDRFEDREYVVCRPDLGRMRLVLAIDGNGPATLAKVVETLGPDRVIFAMNAGMWEVEPSFAPVGLFVSDRVETSALETAGGAGNFFLKPNGVFFVEDGKASVLATEDYAAADRSPEIATQSGPMLVDAGAIHPKIVLPSGSSLKIRNGVGVTGEGGPVFVLSEDRVSFGWLARLFRDELGCSNALYVDGSVSRLHAPELGLRDSSQPVGPVIAAVRR
jgi:uncharacterized protein YigE (DUF2233 family)